MTDNENTKGFTLQQRAEMAELVREHIRHTDVTNMSGFNAAETEQFLRRDGRFAQAGMTQAQILARIAVGI